MGLLVDGKWVDQWYDTKNSDGKFERQVSKFRNTINDQPGAQFPVQSGRYHLYVSLACPWAHRTLIFRQLKGLNKHIDVSVVSPDMLANGWQFSTDFAATGDKLYSSQYLYELYTRAEKSITSRVTVPMLWDKQQHTIVNNESADIIRIFNHSFNQLTGNELDFYPQQLRAQIDDINELVYHSINNGVYKAGFATTQSAYEEAVQVLFAAVEQIEARLGQQRYLVGDVITEADWRLFTTLIRFDAVYVGHFKCNLKRIADYSNLSGYLRELYQVPGVADTVNFAHIKRHYYYSHTMINPTQIVPMGPEIDLTLEHKRDKF